MVQVQSKNIAQEIIQGWHQKKLAQINYQPPAGGPKPVRKTDTFEPSVKPTEKKSRFSLSPGLLLLITGIGALLVALLLRRRKGAKPAEVIKAAEQVEKKIEEKLPEVLKPEQIKKNIETSLGIRLTDKAAEKALEKDKKMFEKNGFYIFDRVFNKTEKAESFLGSRRADYMVVDFWRLAEEAIVRGDIVEAEQHLFNCIKIGSPFVRQNTNLMSKLRELYKNNPQTAFRYRNEFAQISKEA